MKRNTGLYAKVIIMIGSCVNEAQLKTTFNYIQQIRLTDEYLANALMYQYDIKEELFLTENIDVEYQVIKND